MYKFEPDRNRRRVARYKALTGEEPTPESFMISEKTRQFFAPYQSDDRSDTAVLAANLETLASNLSECARPHDDNSENPHNTIPHYFESMADGMLRICDHALELCRKFSQQTWFSQSPHENLALRIPLTITVIRRIVEPIERGQFAHLLRLAGREPTEKAWRNEFYRAYEKEFENLEELSLAVTAAATLKHDGTSSTVANDESILTPTEFSVHTGMTVGNASRLDESERTLEKARAKKRESDRRSKGNRVIFSNRPATPVGGLWKCKKPGCDWKGPARDSHKCTENHDQGIEIIPHRRPR